MIIIIIIIIIIINSINVQQVTQDFRWIIKNNNNVHLCNTNVNKTDAYQHIIINIYI